MRTRAPISPDSDSYRNSGWKRVVSNGNEAHGYASMRWTHSMGMPHGRVVGGPYSSWLKKLPQRAMACIVNRAGAMMSAQRQNGTRRQRAYTTTAMNPAAIPP